MRRSDIKQVRRRLTCAAIRVWQQYTFVEKRLNITFEAVQKFEKALARNEAKDNDLRFDDPGQLSIEAAAIKAQLADLREEAALLSDLATWYKSGHEQLNDMIAFAEQAVKEAE